jgi:heat shock protein beta
MAKIMSAQADAENDPMFKMMKNLPKNLEINPKSPLIEGLLERVLDLELGGKQEDGQEEQDQEEADSAEIIELRETIKVLVDTTMVRSGFTVADPTT